TADAKTFESIEPGAGKRLEAYVERSTLVYETALKHFLYDNFVSFSQLFTTSVIKHAPKMLGLVFRNLDSYVSRYFSDLRLKQLVEYHMVFLGSSPFQAPAIYTLMSHLDYRSGVFYPRRGILSLVEDMRQIGVPYDITYHTNSPVESIVVEDGAAVGVRLSGGETCRADIIVSNADLAFTETKLLSSEYQTYPQKYWDKRQPGPVALLVSLGI
ncbi:hypothetical protein B7Z28_02275, partial [Candidatus Saccharibacteria bacterium 32-45-3]